MAPVQVVQAKCPHCQNLLRIPADWLSRTMRCKFCKNTFQASAELPLATNVTAAAPVNTPASAAPIAMPASAMQQGAPPVAPRPSSGDPFGFDDASPEPRPSIARP